MSLFLSLAERRIQEAMASGDFDIPVGSAISGLDQPYDPMWWVKAWIQREGLDRESLRKLQENERLKTDPSPSLFRE